MISKVLYILMIVSFGISCTYCQKDESNQASTDNFTLTSSEVGQDSLLPIDYTCDGESATLPLEWSGYPKSTKYFVLIMHHVASLTDIHWYWLLYNIPSSVSSLPKNVSGIGVLGTNSVNDHLQYAPPCSQGPGYKKYTYTIYALSDSVVISIAPELVNRDTLLIAIENITLAKASISVYYSRSK